MTPASATGDGIAGVVDQICGNMWSVTPYRGCDIRCTYCCTNAQGRSEPAALPAPDIAAAIEELGADATLIFGAFSDAYPNAEEEHAVTREVLARVLAAGQSVVIVTKGGTIRRDVDLLAAHPGSVTVQISISTLDRESAAAIEPGSPPPAERLALVADLHAAGVRVEVNALPWIPGFSDLEALVAAIPDGVKVTTSPLALRPADDTRSLLGLTWQRSDVVEPYLEERDRLRHLSQISWVRPQAEGHHHPLARFDRPAPLMDLAP